MRTRGQQVRQVGSSIQYLLEVVQEQRHLSPGQIDRKSTRLNSSHQIISYAVFCLKKKNRRHSSSHQSMPQAVIYNAQRACEGLSRENVGLVPVLGYHGHAKAPAPSHPLYLAPAI